MGAIVSKRHSKSLTLESKISCLKKTPFFLYLQDDLLEEFAKCFQYEKVCKEGETILVDSDNVYVVAQGALELKTLLPSPEGKLETNGFLCKKYPGDIIYQPEAQQLANDKVGIKVHDIYLIPRYESLALSKIIFQSSYQQRNSSLTWNEFKQLLVVTHFFFKAIKYC